MGLPNAAAFPPAPSTGPIAVAPEQLELIRAVYQEGLYLQAWQRALELGPPARWSGSQAQVVAGRLAAQLGAPRLASFLFHRAWRSDPADLEACFYRAYEMQERLGPLAALRFLESLEIPETAHRARAADIHLARARVHGFFRDFTAAEACLARAEELTPDRPYVRIQRAVLLDRQDRPDEAIEAAKGALALKPFDRVSTQWMAELLLHRGRDEEALALLTEASKRLESSAVLVQLSMLQRELEQPREAIASLQRALELSPLLEAGRFEWFATAWSSLAWDCGDTRRAVELARLVDDDYYRSAADRMEQAAKQHRVKLPVAYVRQNHLTCAPATLTSIAGLWRMPVDHVEVAERICYDGTPSYSERRWAEENGWMVRPFTVTWESATALLDRGVAFTLATVETTSAHLQAVIGYDAVRRTLLIRDPSTRFLIERGADELLKRYAASGPRGMAMVPSARAELLDGLQLPDTALFDHLDAIEGALADHAREKAQEQYEALSRAAPEHRITAQAARSLARYDSSPSAALLAAEQLESLFPDSPLPKIQKASLLRALGMREEHLATLREAARQPGSDPIFWHALADALQNDARSRDEASSLLRRCIRARPGDTAPYSTLANILWDSGRREEALKLYRIAACMAPHDEDLAWSYHLAAQLLGRTALGLGFLEERVRELGRSSGSPVRTLFRAYENLDRHQDALRALEQAQALRPADGELLLFAAECYGRFGDLERAGQQLEAARSRSREQDWHRAAAKLASYRANPAAALEHWKRVLESEPLALDAHRAAASHLAQLHGDAAALAHLTRATEAFPRHFELRRLQFQWVREDDKVQAERLLDRMIALEPDDAWARRERALLYSATRRFEQAFAEMEVARSLEPDSLAYLQVLGTVRSRAGRIEEAREAYREAIARDMRSAAGLAGLLRTCSSSADRYEALTFFCTELFKQGICAEGVNAFFEEADGDVERDEQLAIAERLRAARPDLWECWWAELRLLRLESRTDDAMRLARELVERFPLTAGSWMELAFTARAKGDLETEWQALEKAWMLNPLWSRAAGELARVYDAHGEHDRARRIFESAARADPLDVTAHGRLAEHLWRHGARQGAIDRIEHALRVDPEYDYGWDVLPSWCEEVGTLERAVGFARSLTVARPGQSRPWLELARLLGEREGAEALAAVERALEIEPRLEGALERRVVLLAQLGRTAEAAAACRPSGWGDSPPLFLRGRAIWLHAFTGDKRRAIAEMKALLQSEPDYRWGLARLYEWQAEEKEWRDAARTAERLRELDPGEPAAHDRLADARLAAGDRPGARAALVAALSAHPEESWFGQRLFELHLEDKDQDAARAVLEKLDPASPEVRIRKALLAAHSGDPRVALEALRASFANGVAEGSTLDSVVQAFVTRGWLAELREALEEALASHGGSRQLADAWGRHVAAPLDRREAWSALESLRASGGHWPSACASYLEGLASARRAWTLRLLGHLHRETLQSDTYVWGTFGYCLVNVGHHGAARRWLRGWQQRPVEQWMLTNVASADAAMHDGDGVRQAVMRALELPADHSADYFRAAGALEHAVLGEARRARELADAAEGKELTPYYAFLLALARAVLAACEQPAFDEAARLLRDAEKVHPGYELDPPAAWMRRRAIGEIDRRARGGWFLLWPLLANPLTYGLTAAAIRWWRERRR